MNVKQLAAYGVIALGVLSIGYGAYSKRSTTQLEKEIERISQSKHKTIQSVGKELESKISHKDEKAKWYFYAGGALIVLGAAGACYCRCKKRH